MEFYSLRLTPKNYSVMYNFHRLRELQIVPTFESGLLRTSTSRRPGSLSPCLLGKQTSGIETRSFRTETVNLKTQDSEEIDVLQRAVFPKCVSNLKSRMNQSKI